MSRIFLALAACVLPLAWLIVSSSRLEPLRNLAAGVVLSSIEIIVIFVLILLSIERANRGSRPRIGLICRSVGYAFPFCITATWLQMGVPPARTTTYTSGLVLLTLAWMGLLIVNRKELLRKRFRAPAIICILLVTICYPVLGTHYQGRFAFDNLAIVSPTEVQSSCAGPALFAHISDVHAVGSTASQTTQGESPGDVRLPRLLEEISAARPSYLLVSGDVTDSGLPDQWKSILDTFRSLRPKTKIIMAPGNHDLSAFFSLPLNLTYLLSSNLPEASQSSEDREFGGLFARFMRAQGELFPDLMDADGKHIGSYINNEPSEQNAKMAVMGWAMCHAGCQLQEEMSRQRRSIDRDALPNRDPLRDHDPLRDAVTAVYCSATCDNPTITSVMGYWGNIYERVFSLYWLDMDKRIAVISLMFEAIDRGQL
jgi:hypothetical protein